MKRYDRQIALPEIGILGQQKLANAKVLIIGVGGLGCPVLQNLAAAGVGIIGVVDGDVIDETNLHRQFLYTPGDCGKSKVAVAAEVVLKQNPNGEIIQYPAYFNRENCFDIVSDYQIIVDCTDSILTRYLINDVAVTKGIPMVYASIHKFEGQLSVFNYHNGPTYRCLFPEDERLEAIPNCDDSGVLGVLPTILGTMQANEVLKIVLGIGVVLSGKLTLYNSLDNNLQTIEIQKNTDEFEKAISNGKHIQKTEMQQLFSGVFSSQILHKMADENLVLIDIREDYEEPRLDFKSINNVPLSKLEAFMKDIDKRKKIILLCQHGKRSELAADYLIRQGFPNVFYLPEGVELLEKRM